MSLKFVRFFVLFVFSVLPFVFNIKIFKSDCGCAGCGKIWQRDVNFKKTNNFSVDELRSCFGREISQGDLCSSCFRDVYRWRESGKVSLVSTKQVSSILLPKCFTRRTL